MKQFLLFCTLACSMFLSNAQMVSFGVNFEGTLASTFSYHGATVDLYAKPNAAPATGCTPNNGLITGPSLWSSGQNQVGFTTEEISSIGSNSLITVSFAVYTFDGKKNEVTDCDLLSSTFPCTITVTVTILSATGNTVYGENTVTVTPGVTTIGVPITASLSPGTDGTPFRIMFDLNNQNADCAGVKDVTFAIDDLSVTEADEPEEAPLPVHFKSFNANRQSSTVAVSWTTATEQNNMGFNVQRNIGGVWKTVAFISSKALHGNSDSDISYTYTDINNEKGITQYRIQQVDRDGKFAYTDIRAIRGDGVVGKLVVYPNPSTDGKINIVFEDNNGFRDVQVNDMQGRVIKSFKNISNNILVIDKLSSGFYTIRVFNRATSGSSVQKIVIR